MVFAFTKLLICLVSLTPVFLKFSSTLCLTALKNLKKVNYYGKIQFLFQVGKLEICKFRVLRRKELFLFQKL
jgi:hypothetical protein